MFSLHPLAADMKSALSDAAELALNELHSDGWSLGHTTEAKAWLVLGRNGTKIIKATGPTLEDAWLNALEQVKLSDARK